MARLKSALQRAWRVTRDSSLFYWLPPLVWMAAIFYFSTDTFSGGNTGSLFYRLARVFIPSLTLEQFAPIHFSIRKAAHFTEYAILALLLFRAFRARHTARWNYRWALYAWVIVVLYAFADEWHQSFTRYRVGSMQDSLTDIAGGTTALLLLWWLRGKRREEN
jgi:VanZ family protein